MFRLLRSFSLTSFVALTLALGATLWLTHRSAVDRLMRLGEDNNVALARVMGNAVWPVYALHFARAQDLDGDAIRALHTTKELDLEIRRLARFLPVLKVKIFSLAGNTLYSSEAAQIGEKRPNHPAIVRARQGGVTTELIERGKFSAMDGERGRVNLMASYVPVESADRQPIGVFEVYSDVTGLVAEMSHAQWAMGIRLGAIFLVLYTALLIIGVKVMLHAVRKGPASDAPPPAEAAADPVHAAVRA